MCSRLGKQRACIVELRQSAQSRILSKSNLIFFPTAVDFSIGKLYNYKKLQSLGGYYPFPLGGRIDQITVISYGLGKRFGI